MLVFAVCFLKPSSEKGLRDQENHFRRHVDLLVENLTKVAESRERTDMVSWFNMITFDIIGSLAFGKSFGCLEGGGNPHDWIPGVFESVRFTVQNAVCKAWGPGFLSRYLLSGETKKARIKNYMYARERITSRMQYGADRGDFWDKILIKSEKNELTGEGMSPG